MTTEEVPEEKIVMDGHITIIVNDPYSDCAITHTFQFNEIDIINFEHWGVRINKLADEKGQEEIFCWPWTSILQIKHLTNSTEVAEALKQRDIGKYAQEGLDFIEKLANGRIPEGDTHAHVHSNEEGTKVAHGFETPCGHGEAVKSANAPVWTCLICASQWHADAWEVE